MFALVLLLVNLFFTLINYYILMNLIKYIKGSAEKCKSGSDKQESKK